HDEILRSPAAQSAVRHPKNFSSQLEQAKLKAAEVRYTLGEQSLEQNTRESAKEAYYHFQRADEIRPAYRDAQAQMRQAREMATVFVQVEPIPMHSRTFKLSNEFFENQVHEFLQTSGISPFVQFITPRDAQTYRQSPDHVVQLMFDDFVVGQTLVRERIHKRSRDSVVLGTVDVKENGETVTRDVYGTVEAEVHLFEKVVDSRGLLDMQILDANSRSVLSQKKFGGSFTWREGWGFFNGDKRALTRDDQRILRRRREVADPSPQALFVEFTKPIYSDLTRYLRDYYRGF
ncbi:MAG: hypothetical protein AAGI38_15845, partial [Bacteroidota bacterium]